MEGLLEAIEDYWTNRAEGYSQVNLEELAGPQWPVWLSVIESHMPKKAKEDIKILDVGTGPGFFAIILARAGYQVTAVDYTGEMLKKARENAGLLADEISWRQMDAQHLDFEDAAFDMVVSRNVTWNLEHPETAYREWVRVLKPDGRLLNFDANWYRHLFDADKRAAYEADRARVSEQGLKDEYTCTDIDAMEAIARKVPLGRIERPEWDCRVLQELHVTAVNADTDIWQRVWCEAEKINYASTPMFLVSCRKADSR